MPSSGPWYKCLGRLISADPSVEELQFDFPGCEGGQVNRTCPHRGNAEQPVLLQLPTHEHKAGWKLSGNTRNGQSAGWQTPDCAYPRRLLCALENPTLADDSGQSHEDPN